MFFLALEPLNAPDGGLEDRQVGTLGILDFHGSAQIGEAFSEVGSAIFFQSVVRLARVFSLEPPENFWISGGSVVDDTAATSYSSEAAAAAGRRDFTAVSGRRRR